MVDDKTVRVKLANESAVFILKVVMKAFLKVPRVRLDTDLGYRAIWNQENLPRRDVAILSHIAERRVASTGKFAAIESKKEFLRQTLFDRRSVDASCPDDVN